MREQLLEQAQLAVELGLKAGADDVVASVSWGRGLKFEWRAGRLEKVQESTSRRLGLAIYVDGRFSTSSTNDLDPGRLEHFAREGVDLTRCLEEDPYRKITSPELYAGRSTCDLDLCDPALAELSREQRIDWCREMEERARADDLIVTAESFVSDSHGIAARASSNGFAGVEEETGIFFFTKVTAREGEKRPESHNYAGATHLEDLPTPASISDEALSRAHSRIGADKISSRRCSMLLDPDAGAGFLGRIFGALSAGAVQQKRSFLAQSLDTAVACDLLSLTDEPLRVRGMGSAHYDGEGIACKPRCVIEDGILRTFFVDTYYGRKLGWSATTASSSNTVFRHGDHDLAGILASVQDGILVTSWLGGNADMTTGDFSFGLRGHLIRGGELVAPVSEMNVTGNYAEVLKSLVEVGNDPRPWATFRSPSLLFDDVQFSGS